MTTTPADSASRQSDDATTPVEPSTDTAAAPADTVFTKDTDRPIGWFARGRRAMISHARRWIGVLLLSTALIAAGCEGWLLLQNNRTSVAATQARPIEGVSKGSVAGPCARGEYISSTKVHRGVNKGARSLRDSDTSARP